MKHDINQLAINLEQDVRELCKPGGRMVGTPGHSEAEGWVARRLYDIGCKPYSGDSFALHYMEEGLAFTNFAGFVPGKDRSLAPVLIGAHYDSAIPHPCADDNGAAVAIAMAVGESVAEAGGLERDLVVAIFDAEEPPYFQSTAMGSIRFYEDQLDKRGVHFALISDLVGHDVNLPGDMLSGIPATVTEQLTPLTFATGSESHPDLPTILQGLQTPSGMKLIATLNEYIGDMSDHGIFRENDVPYLFLSCGRWKHYHEPTDTPGRLNYHKMAAIAQYSEDVCRAAATASLPTDVSKIDPVEFEASTWQSALGPICEPVAGLLGVPDFNSRNHIGRAARALQSLGL